MTGPSDDADLSVVLEARKLNNISFTPRGKSACAALQLLTVNGVKVMRTRVGVGGTRVHLILTYMNRRVLNFTTTATITTGIINKLIVTVRLGVATFMRGS